METNKKLAIISTFDDLCGIASYTRSIVEQLAPYFEIKIFDLDQFLFRGSSTVLKKLADREIERICADLKNYDCVNIQLEHGTFGSETKDIIKRLFKILDASPTLCITFHTVLQNEKSLFDMLLKNIKKFDINSLVKTYNHYKSVDILSGNVYKKLKTLQRSKDVSVIVHTRRDARNLKLLYALENVYDHPLSYFSPTQSHELRMNTGRKDFSILKGLGPEITVIGLFGFFGEYKGIDTALTALKNLPSNFHIAIFGGLHPNAITKNSPVDPFVKKLLLEIGVGKKLLDEAVNYPSNIRAQFSADELIEISRRSSNLDLSKRVHFLGSLSENDFPKAMIASDIVLLPYLEVGQSASGPMAMATNLGCNIVASRTKTFIQFERYYPGSFQMFDIGNYLQLAQILNSLEQSTINSTKYEFSVESNVATYIAALH